MNKTYDFLLSKVGGSLKLNLMLTYGTMTFPALFTGLNPVIPVTVSWGLQVLFKTRSKWLFVTGWTPYKKP